MDENPLTVRQLFELARKGMIWRGQSIENKIDSHSTAKMWVNEEDVTPGVIAVKSAAMHDNYVKWCKDRGITGKSVLNNVAFGRFLKQTFKATRYDNATHYYINKNMDEDPNNKQKRQEKYTIKKKKNQGHKLK